MDPFKFLRLNYNTHFIRKECDDDDDGGESDDNMDIGMGLVQWLVAVSVVPSFEDQEI